MSLTSLEILSSTLGELFPEIEIATLMAGLIDFWCNYHYFYNFQITALEKEDGHGHFG